MATKTVNSNRNTNKCHVWLFLQYMVFWLLNMAINCSIVAADFTYSAVGLIGNYGLLCFKIMTKKFSAFYGFGCHNYELNITNKRLKYFERWLKHFWNRISIGYMSNSPEKHLLKNLIKNGKRGKVKGTYFNQKIYKLQKGQRKMGRLD